MGKTTTKLYSTRMNMLDYMLLIFISVLFGYRMRTSGRASSRCHALKTLQTSTRLRKDLWTMRRHSCLHCERRRLCVWHVHSGMRIRMTERGMYRNYVEGSAFMRVMYAVNECITDSGL